MTYQRFKLPGTLATVATTATLLGEPPPTVADVATVAGASCENRGFEPQSVATVANGVAHREDAASEPSKRLLDDVAIGIERAAAELRSLGCSETEIQIQAAAIVRADLRNGMALYLPQADPHRCRVCGDRETFDRPLVPLLNAATITSPDRHHWLHRGECHDEHIRRIDARIAGALDGVASVETMMPAGSASQAGRHPFAPNESV